MPIRPVNPFSCGNADPPAGRTLVLGGGYTGQRFAAALRRLDLPVLSTRRQAGSDASHPDDGVICFDPAVGALPPADALAGVTHVLVTIPPDAEGRDPVLESLGEQLARLPLHWLGYLSTTGVYGDSGGAWVDETSPTQPGLERSQARLACERAWRRSGLPVQIFRLPAIYGPGRSPFAGLRNGTARLVHKPGQVFSRVHVEDIVGALLHCLALPAQHRPDTLIVADAVPAPSSETLGYAAHLLNCKLPDVQPYSQIAAQLSPMARSFWSENRRASNRLLCQELGYRLRFPSYREGYRDCLSGEEGVSGAGARKGTPSS
jgi:nucleoside-diphosphate-sugar epimerase